MTDVHSVITENIDVWTSAIKKRNSQGRGSSKKLELVGVSKLRELIFELAVQGKLVPQDPKDEHASILVKRIASKKKQLIEDKKIKKTKKLPEIVDNDKPFELPNSWIWGRLGDVTNYGVNDKAEAINTKAETWVLELEDVEKGTSRLIKKVRFSERQFKSSKNVFSKGDVIYGKLRPYLDKVLVADEDGVCTTEMIPISSYSVIEPAFLRLVMKSPYFKTYANNSTHGMNLPRMGTDKARLALLPIVAVPEQHRIVAKVDELMVLCDQLEQQTEDSITAHKALVEILLDALTNSANAKGFNQSWTRIAQHFDILFTTEDSIDQLKQTILQLAVMGKLVPQDPSDEPASVLLGQIAKEKERLVKEKKIKKEKALPLIGDDEKPFELPTGWEWSRFASFSNEIATGPFGTMIHKRDYVVKGTPLINPSHMINSVIEEDESISVSDSKAKELSSYKLFENDIVMARRGEMGRCALVSKREENWLCGTGSFVLRFYSELSRRYILLLFKTKYVRDYLGGNSIGTTMTNLNHGILNKMPLLVPPVKEQYRIVAKIDELMALCDQLKAQLSDAQTTQLHLADAIVEQAVG